MQKLGGFFTCQVMTKKQDISGLPLEEQRRILDRRDRQAARVAAFSKEELENFKRMKKKAADKYREKNRETIRIAGRAYAKKRMQEEPDKTLVTLKRYRLKHPEKLRASQAKYRRVHRLKVNAAATKRYAEDINFKIARNLRSRLYQVLQGNLKGRSGVRDLGCSVAELRAYLEAKFLPGMTWENNTKHGWHVDHIRPFASFDLTDQLQVLEACHYTNLQPLWARDNLSKGGRWEPPVPDNDNELEEPLRFQSVQA